MDTLEEIVKFLETHNLPRLNQQKNRNPNILLTSNEIELVVKKLPTEPDGFTGKLYQIFKEELISILLKVFQTIEEEGTLPNSFYEASITLMPKTGNTLQIKKITCQYP